MAPRRQVTYSNRPNHAARAAHRAGERQFKTYDTSHIRPKKSKAPIIVAIILAIVVIGGLGWGGFTLFKSCSAEPAAAETLAEGESVTLTIPEGSGAMTISELLFNNRVIGDSSEFVKFVTGAGHESALKPGTYTFTGPLTTEDVVGMLVAGPGDESFTVPEGFTIRQTAERVAEAYPDTITAEEFLARASDASAYEADYPFVAGAYDNTLEGFLFPKTYPLIADATADAVVRQMLDQYKTEIATIDFSYAEQQGLNQYQVLIVASLIEREASLDDERPTVSSVIYNRMAADMLLQIDATIAYAKGSTEITQEDLDTDGPFNTYLNKGLPPGPICSPGLSSLKAAAQPADTTYLYYVVSGAGDGSHNFSETYEEHQNNIAQS
ncbi:endolytic transglycosylase MltG [Raoultibacter phocaeensis]|uniref:endolytic transglycosylase MltG n=1 Tax=Raoultibacter phocaeensis TaxID=2479841 RepID=UPI00111B85B5|nr:endolytic transglycosylase MltG [Raoultibacter phocaeensis]